MREALLSYHVNCSAQVHNSEYTEIRVDAIAHIWEVIAWMDLRSKGSVNRLQTDSAKKFPGLTRQLNMKSVELAASSAHSPESNGLAKQMNRKLVDEGRSSMKEAYSAR